MAEILLAEDIPIVREALTRMLEHFGHRVCAARDGLEAAAMFDRQSFDVAVVDIRMPERDGISLLKYVKARKSSLPVIIISGGGPERSLETAFSIAEANGAFGVLVKPVEPDDLLGMIDRALAARGSLPHGPVG